MYKYIYCLFLLVIMNLFVENVDVHGSGLVSVSYDQKGNKELTIDSETISKDTNIVTINIDIPIIKGLENNNLQTEINNTIKKKALHEKVIVMATAREDEQLAQEQGRTFLPYELSVNYQVKQKEGILSFIVTTYTFTGGAHGITETDYYNVDLVNGDKIDLIDLFKEGSNFKRIINAEIIMQIKKQEAAGEGQYFDPDDAYVGDNAFQSIRNDQPFYIEDGNIVIAFAQYEIAPGYMGQPTFEIPLTKIKAQLKEDYLKLISEN